MQLAAGVVRVVHARDAEAQLEPQVLVVAQRLAHLDEVLARDVQRELARGRRRPTRRPRAKAVAGLVEHLGRGCRRPRRTSRRTAARSGRGSAIARDQPAVAGGVARAAGAEHAAAGRRRPRSACAPRRGCSASPPRARPRWSAARRSSRRPASRRRRRRSSRRHCSSPFICDVGVAASAAASAARGGLLAVDAERLVLDLLVQREDRVDQHLGPRRAAGQVDVDRDDVVDALHDRVVVEHAAGADAHTPIESTHLGSDIWS